ncbi:hypothetical protein HK101_000823 [Irineochytrium annulatum]|nr:hypothetical protein HK101_000823 [Irineochytrium annulatum]
MHDVDFFNVTEADMLKMHDAGILSMLEKEMAGVRKSTSRAAGQQSAKKSLWSAIKPKKSFGLDASLAAVLTALDSNGPFSSKYHESDSDSDYTDNEDADDDDDDDDDDDVEADEDDSEDDASSSRSSFNIDLDALKLELKDFDFTTAIKGVRGAVPTPMYLQKLSGIDEGFGADLERAKASKIGAAKTTSRVVANAGMDTFPFESKSSLADLKAVNEKWNKNLQDVQPIQGRSTVSFAEIADEEATPATIAAKSPEPVMPTTVANKAPEPPRDSAYESWRSRTPLADVYEPDEILPVFKAQLAAAPERSLADHPYFDDDELRAALGRDIARTLSGACSSTEIGAFGIPKSVEDRWWARIEEDERLRAIADEEAEEGEGVDGPPEQTRFRKFLEETKAGWNRMVDRVRTTFRMPATRRRERKGKGRI